MQIVKDFGINPYLLIAQIVNFLIVLYVLKRFMYKPLLSVMKKRDDEIKKGLEDADEGKRLLAQAEEKEKQILQSAQERTEKIVKDAKLEAAEARLQSEEATKKEIERTLEESRIQLLQETKQAEEKLTKNIGSIAVSLLEKTLTGIFGKSEQEVILRKANLELKKAKTE